MATHSSILAWRIPWTKEPGGLLSSFLFILLSFLCSMAVMSTILSSSLLMHSSFTLLLIPSSELFISLIVHLCLFFKASSSLLNISCILSVPPFFFWDLESSLLLLFQILFQVDCLSPLHLVVLVFYLVPLFGRYLSVFVVIAIPPSEPPGTCAGFLVGGIGACPLVGGVGFCPSGGQGHVKGYIFSSLLAGGRGYVSTLLVVWPEHAGCWVGPGLSSKMVTSRSAHTNGYSLGCPPPVSLPHSELLPTMPPQETLQDL